MQYKKIARIALRFLIINIAVLILTFPVIAIWGPFDNIRNSVVGAVATSRHHSWIEAVLSKEEIAKTLTAPKATKITLKLPSFSNLHSGSVKLTRISGDRFKGYLLEVSDPTRLKVGVSNEMGTKGQKTSEIAKASNAIAAINAGGFNDPAGQGTGGIPYGVVIHNGVFLAGENLKGKVSLVGFNRSGSLVVGNYTVSEMKNMRITEGVSFAPPLILNGKKQISGDGGWGIAPRTAIGQRKDGTVLLLVIDGRQPPTSIGATMLDVQNILYDNGAYTAGNLDGGSSATMYYNGKVVNNPGSLMGIMGERDIPTVFFVR